MNKVIKINGLNYRAEISTGFGTVCGKCAFFSGICPTDDTGNTSCYAFGDDSYFVAEPSKPLVEEFKETAGITTEQTFTESQVRAAYTDWVEADEAERFVEHLKKFADPEYQEFLRLQAKFSRFIK